MAIFTCKHFEDQESAFGHLKLPVISFAAKSFVKYQLKHLQKQVTKVVQPDREVDFSF